MNTNRILCRLTSIVVLAISFNLETADIFGQESDPAPSQPTPTPQSQETPDLSKYGVVEYNSPPIEDRRKWERRHQINRRYDNQDWVVKSISNPEVGGVGKITEDPPPPLFPIDESALIVVGNVETVKAYLSNDKGAVYSEITVHVSDVLKATADLNVRNGDSIVTDRLGGRVKYPNGQIVRYGFSGQGSPAKGKNYLFFLSRAEQGNYNILTAYELLGNKVQALDGARVNLGRGNWAFDKHNDEDYQDFRKTVERAVKNSHTGKPKRFNP